MVAYGNATVNVRSFSIEMTARTSAAVALAIRVLRNKLWPLADALGPAKEHAQNIPQRLEQAEIALL